MKALGFDNWEIGKAFSMLADTGLDIINWLKEPVCGRFYSSDGRGRFFLTIEFDSGIVKTLKTFNDVERLVEYATE